MITSDKLFTPLPSSKLRIVLTLIEHAIAYNGFMVLMLGVFDNFLPESLAQFLRTYLIGFLVNFLQASGDITTKLQLGDRERSMELLQLKLNCSRESADQMIGRWYHHPTIERIKVNRLPYTDTALLAIQSEMPFDLGLEISNAFPELTTHEQHWLLHRKKLSLRRSCYRLLCDNQGRILGALLAMAMGPILVSSDFTHDLASSLPESELDFAITYAMTYFIRELGNYIEIRLSHEEFQLCINYFKHKIFGTIDNSVYEAHNTPLNPLASSKTYNTFTMIETPIPAQTFCGSLRTCLYEYNIRMRAWFHRRSRHYSYEIINL